MRCEYKIDLPGTPDEKHQLAIVAEPSEIRQIAEALQMSTNPEVQKFGQYVERRSKGL